MAWCLHVYPGQHSGSAGISALRVVLVYRGASPSMHSADFAPLGGGSADGQQKRNIATPLQNDRGERRKYLNVFETVAPQLLNAYGEAKYNRLTNEA